ncbi:Trehalose utilization [Terriglobus roseus DSM 18391]|uniref:Trehalose utilization n=1 Tax=Terriglobus roseus (strain DSM 18391 / NRRL B-41598 / KBS 63) TaxID=926566 RepID=I3ZDH5_TERRK|nr:ThuA domain-containing protein [Terriglobus roseus]AFL87293.1 Trehalose utilization [Terriglobus roseus DSM 18391]
MFSGRVLTLTMAMTVALAMPILGSAQAPATTDTGCPAPGARGPRPGGLGGPGGAGGPGAGAARPQGPPPEFTEAPAGSPKKHLLIWADTRNGIAQHDIGHAIAIIEELGYKSGAYDTWIRTDSNIISRHPKMTTGEPASGGPSLCNVDAIFFMGHREIELSTEQKTDLLWFVHDAGKGFVAAHVGDTAFLSWPEFGEMLGGRFDQHPWGTIEGSVIVTDPKFPGLSQFGPSFTIRDEFYQSSGFSPDKSRVLMRLDTTKIDKTKARGMQAADYPYALAWAKMYGKGRVFYATFAHAPSTWDNPKIQEMYLQAIKWSLGEIEADVTPLKMPPPTPDALPTPAAIGTPQ